MEWAAAAMEIFQSLLMESTVVTMSPRGAMSHQLTGEPVRPGKRARLKRPKDITAPEGPLVTEEHRVAAATIQNAAKMHLVKSI